jgi:hypothetical protein
MLCYLLYDYGVIIYVIICDYCVILLLFFMYQCVCSWVHDGTCLGKHNRQNKDDRNWEAGWLVLGAQRMSIKK